MKQQDELYTILQDNDLADAIWGVVQAAKDVYAREVPEKGYTIVTTSSYVDLMRAVDALEAK